MIISNEASIIKLVIEKGVTFSVDIARKSKDGSVIDMSGVDAVMKIHKSHGDKSEILSLDSNGNGIIIDGLNGNITITITDEQTKLITETSGKYYLDLSFTDGSVKRLMKGGVDFKGAL